MLFNSTYNTLKCIFLCVVRSCLKKPESRPLAPSGHECKFTQPLIDNFAHKSMYLEALDLSRPSSNSLLFTVRTFIQSHKFPEV